MKILGKGTSQPLQSVGELTLQHVAFELGWDCSETQSVPLISRLLKPVPKVDLDASCLLFDAAGGLVERICDDHLVSCCASVRHSGDSTDGNSEGEDEIIAINLPHLPDSVRSLLFAVTSFSGQTLDHVHNAYARLIDLDRRMDLVSFDLSGIGAHTGILVAMLYREDDGWHVKAIGDTLDVCSLDELPPEQLAAWLNA